MTNPNPSLPVVILAGGSKSRTFPLNDGNIKGSELIFGQAIFERTLENLAQHGFDQLIIIVNSQEEKDRLTEHSATKSATIIIQPEPTGMGDAVLLAADHLSGSFAVIASYHYKAGEVLAAMRQTDPSAVLCSTHTDTPWRYGIIEIEKDQAVSIVEKPEKGSEPSNLKLQACYILDQQYLDILKNTPSENYSFETALNNRLQAQPIAVHHNDVPLPSLKFAWQLFDFQAAFTNQLQSRQDTSAQVAKSAIIDESNGSVQIEAGAKVGEFAKIVGPCYIGKNALVGDYSFVRQSSLEEKATVGAKTEVVRSILQPGCSLHFGYLADSILGAGAKVGAGLITANKRLDRASIKTLVKDTKVDTGRTALGTVIGPKAQLGIHTGTMPGVLIGAGAMIMPGSIVSKNVAAHSTHQK